MSERGGQAGNQNAAKGKIWSAAIQRALDRLGDPSINPDDPIERTPRMKALDQLAEAFVLKVNGGDLGFYREFGDRMEGKAPQSLTLAGDSEAPLEMNVRTVRFVEADGSPAKA